MRTTTLTLVLASMLLSACDRNPAVSLSAATAVGSYVGNYPDGGVESFIIQPDGTFTQSLSVSNRTMYTNSGRWRIDGSYVVFKDVFLARDVWKLNDRKPAKVASYDATWHPYGPMIIFSDEEHFWIEKQSK